MKRGFFHVLAVLLLALLAVLPAQALDDDEFDGLAADELVIEVGYFGGPYYEKAVFSLDELWAMDVVYADYTFIDNMPSVVIDHVAGIRLSDLMDAAGIDVNSIQYFYFWTRDKQSDYYTSFTKAALIDASRYCYYSLPDNYDDEGDGPNEYATSYGVPVDTVIALGDDWNRCIAGATFGSDYLNLNTNTRFRLIFGQTNGTEHTASRSAKWIHKIVVELGGAPTLTLDTLDLEGEVGSVLRTEASVDADSAVLANETIHWSSSDESIATVDADGNITIHSEGSAIITAEFAGAVTSVVVNGTSGEEEPDFGEPAGIVDAGNSENAPEQLEEAPEEETPEETPDETLSEVPPVETPDIEEITPEPEEAMPEPEEITPEPEIVDTPPEEPAVQPEPVRMILKPVNVTETDMGGIQNWRESEMSETARELPNIAVPASALLAFGLAAGVLFFASGGIYAVLFYQNIAGRRKNVHKSK